MKSLASAHRTLALISLTVFSLLLFSCSPNTTAPTEEKLDNNNQVTSTPDTTPATATLILQPIMPSEMERTLEDTNSSYSAAKKRATAGDNILNNLFERPFNKEMLYQPDVDILKVSIAQDDNFYFFTISLKGADAASGLLTANYGIEFDLSKNGRGDMLILVQDMQKEWSSENVFAYRDADGDVGGPKPVIADANYDGNGFEEKLVFSSDKTAYARLSPDDPFSIQIAVSRGLLGNTDEFLWGGWADNGVNNLAFFDYNDHFGPGVAGSPLTGKYYPLKSLYSLDNTCRMAFGFSPSESIPGMCLSSSRGGGNCVCPPCADPTGASCLPCAC